VEKNINIKFAALIEVVAPCISKLHHVSSMTERDKAPFLRQPWDHDCMI